MRTKGHHVEHLDPEIKSELKDSELLIRLIKERFSDILEWHHGGRAVGSIAGESWATIATLLSADMEMEPPFDPDDVKRVFHNDFAAYFAANLAALKWASTNYRLISFFLDTDEDWEGIASLIPPDPNPSGQVPVLPTLKWAFEILTPSGSDPT